MLTAVFTKKIFFSTMKKVYLYLPIKLGCIAALLCLSLGATANGDLYGTKYTPHPKVPLVVGGSGAELTLKPANSANGRDFVGFEYFPANPIWFTCTHYGISGNTSTPSNNNSDSLIVTITADPSGGVARTGWIVLQTQSGTTGSYTQNYDTIYLLQPGTWCMDPKLASVGNEFFVAFMENAENGSGTNTAVNLHLYATTDADSTKVKVYNSDSQDAPDSITLRKARVEKIFTKSQTDNTNIHAMPAYNWEYEKVTSKSLRVEADSAISLSAYNAQAATSGISYVIPTTGLGDEYFVASYSAYMQTSTSDAMPEEFMIIATEDTTRVTITPSDETFGSGNYSSTSGTNPRKARDPFTVTLHKGQTYLVRSRQPATNEHFIKPGLTGTHVKASRPVAVFGGHKRAGLSGVDNTSCASNSRDLLFEQLLPLRSWGKRYAFTLTSTGSNVYRIVAAYDNTAVTVNTGSGAVENLTIHRGKYVEGRISEQNTQLYAYIEASQPVEVMLFAESYDCIDNPKETNNIGDPFMIALGPVDRGISRATFAPVELMNTGTAKHRMTVIAETRYAGQTKLERISNSSAAQITLSAFTEMPNTPYSYTTATVEYTNTYNYRLSNPYGFTAYAYGYSTFEAYGYLLGAQLGERSEESASGLSKLEYCRGDTGRVLPSCMDGNTPCSTQYFWYETLAQWNEGKPMSNLKINTDRDTIYTLFATYKGSCGYELYPQPVTVEVKPLPTPTLSDLTVCLDAAADVSYGGLPVGGYYVFADGASSGSMFQHKSAGEGAHKVAYRYIERGCVAADTAVITVEALDRDPFIRIAKGDDTICNGDTVRLEVANANGRTFQWYYENMSASSTLTLISGGTTSTYDVAPGTSYYQDGKFSAYVFNANGCKSIVSDTIKIYPKAPMPDITTVSNTNACAGASYTLYDREYVGMGSEKRAYQWYKTDNNPGNKIPGATAYEYTMTNDTSPGVHRFLLGVANLIPGRDTAAGCWSYDTYDVTINALPSTPSIATSTGIPAFCYGDSLVLTAAATNSSGNTYEWWYRDVSGSISQLAAPPGDHITVRAQGSYSVRNVSTAGCKSKEMSKEIAIAMRDAPGQPTVSIVNSSACEGDTVSIDAKGALPTGGTESYQWYAVNAGSSFPIEHATSYRHRVTESGSYTARALYTYTYSTGNLTCSSDLGAAQTVALWPQPGIPDITGGQNVCVGSGNVTLTATPVGTLSVSSYQWYKNGAQMTSAVGSTMQVTQTAGSASYTVVAISEYGCRSQLQATGYPVTAWNPTVAITGSTSRNACFGDVVKLETSNTAVDNGLGGSYVWYKNSDTIKENIISFLEVRDVGTAHYQVRIIDSWGCGSSSSNVVTVTIYPSLTPAIKDTAVCAGNNLTLTATPPGAATYQWFFEGDGSSSVDLGTVSITNTLKIADVASQSNEGQYRVKVTGSNGCAAEGEGLATVNILPNTPSVVPAATAICEGDSTSLLASVTSFDRYEWYLKNENGKAWLSPVSSRIYVKQPGNYSVRVMSARGCWSGESAEVAIATHRKPEKPVISPAADPVAVCASTPITFTAFAAGATSFQWYAVNPDETHTTIANASSASYDVGIDGYYVARAYIQYGSLSCPSDSVSAKKQAILYPVPPMPTVAVAGSNPTCAGDTVTLYNTQIFSLPIATYRWYRNDLPLYSTTSDTCFVTQVEEATYTVAVVSNMGCLSPTSIAQKVSIRRPEVSIDNSDETICFGSTVELTASANTGLNSTYEWFKDNIPIPDVTTPLYTVKSEGDPRTSQTASYKVYVTDDGGCRSVLSSNTVTIRINELPPTPVVTSPEPSCAGSDVMFAATPSGAGSYQWFHEGSAGQLTPVTVASSETTCRIENISMSAAGGYVVRLINRWGCQSESRGQAVVYALPQDPVISPYEDVHLCTGDSVPLMAVTANPASGQTYKWFFDNGSGSLSNLPDDNDRIYAKMAGTYSVFGVSEHKCESSGSGTVAVAIHRRPEVPAISPDGSISVCANYSTSITAYATGASLYQWYAVNTTTNVTTALVGDTSSSFEVKESGRYAVRAYIRYGNQFSCSSPVGTPKEVELLPVPAAPVIAGEATEGGEKTSGCEGEILTLSATLTPNSPQVSSYRWYKNDVEMTFATDSACSVTQVEEALYTVAVISDKGCRSPASAPKSVAIRTRPTVSIAANVREVCHGNTITLSATTVPPDIGGGSYEWYENGELMSDASTSPIYVVQGSGNPLVGKNASCYLFVKDGNGCRSAASSNTVEVNIRELPPTPVVTVSALTSAGVCEGANATLRVSPSRAGTYSWFKRVGRQLDTLDVTSDTIYRVMSAQPADAGQYAVEISNTYGCKSTDMGETMLNVLNLPEVAIIQEYACEDWTEFDFATPAGGLFSGWGCTEDGRFVPADVHQGRATVTYTYKAPNGCSNSDTKIIELIGLPNTPIVAAAGPTEVCEDSISVTLQIVGDYDYTYQWYKDDAELPGEQASAYVANKEGSYAVKACTRGCWTTKASAPIAVSVLALPEPPVIAAQNPAICPGGATTLSVASQQQGIFQWYKGDINKMDKILNEIAATYTAGEAGQYAVDFVGANGCRSEFSNLLTVGEYPLPRQPEIVPSQANLYAGLDYKLLVKNPQADEEYGWYKNNLSVDVTGTTFSVDNLDGADTGNYTVRVVDQHGCYTWSEPYLLAWVDATLFVPNIFTPNGDGINDYFQILGLEDFVENKLEVRNKYGGVIFSQKNYHNRWSGDGLPNDVYYYTLSLKREDGASSLVNGYIHLKR
jgi:gliding motility-associated-like protein